MLEFLFPIVGQAARFAILKALRSGDLICNWDQMVVGNLQPIPSFDAFDIVFGAWPRYDPAQAAPDFVLRKLRPNSDSSPTHSAAMTSCLKFSEYRYLNRISK